MGRNITELTGVTNPTDLLIKAGADTLYSAVGHNHAGVYQPVAANLTSLAGLTLAGNGTLVVRVNAAGTALELAAVSGGGGGGTWGSITGTLSSQTDLQAALDAKADTTALTTGLAGKQAAGTYATGTGTASGTNTGDQTITLTGDVTGSGTGSFAASIGANKVTLAQMAQVATGSVFYRKTAATGNPEVQTLATLKTDLGLTGTNSGDQTITLTGDVTGSGTGSFATAIGANKVTLAQMATTATGTLMYRKTAATGNWESQTLATLKTDLGLTGTNSGDQFTSIATGSFIANNTGSTGAATAVTAANATAMLNAVVGDSGSGGTKGLVPAPATGDAAAGKFLKADGTWTAPSAGGASLTYVSNAISTYITLAASTWTDGPSVSITAGTWFICAPALVQTSSSTNDTVVTLKLYSATAVITAMELRAKGGGIPATLSGIYVATGSDTVKLAGFPLTTTDTSHLAPYPSDNNPNGASAANATQIIAIKIA